MRKLVGVGYRRPLAAWIAARPKEIGCLEITAEHFFDGDRALLRTLRSSYPLTVHGVGLSLGTPGALDPDTLERFSGVVAAADPLYITEHVAFTRTPEVDLGHLNPLARTRANLRILADHARELMDRCAKPLLLENIATSLDLRGDMDEPEFLNRLCDEAGCGLLLDVTNLYVNSRTFGFDPSVWLSGIEPENVVQVHIVGYSHRRGRWIDAHAEPIQNELFDLAELVVARSDVESIILERDENIPAPGALVEELRALGALHVG